MMINEPPPFTPDSQKSEATLPKWMTRLGLGTISFVRLLLLAIICLLTVLATISSVVEILRTGKADISDVLLMFIYLEIWMMIAIEATTRRLPVNIIVYIAITVLARHLVGVAGDKSTTDIGLLVDAGAILILAVAAVLLEIASRKLVPDTPAKQS